MLSRIRAAINALKGRPVAEDTYSYWFESADLQPAHVTRGLASLLTDWSDGVTVVHMQEDDD